MRHRYIFAALMILVLVAGCSTNRNTARAEDRLNSSNQQIIAASVTGSMPVVDGLETRSQQDLTNLQAHYLAKAQQANTPEESQQWLDLSNQANGSGGSTLATLVNASSYRIVVENGPYAGMVLEPGASSPSAVRVPVGSLTFSVVWGSYNQRATIYRYVSAGQKTIVIVNK